MAGWINTLKKSDGLVIAGALAAEESEALEADAGDVAAGLGRGQRSEEVEEF